MGVKTLFASLPASLIHPIAMSLLIVLWFWGAYLGLRIFLYRRQNIISIPATTTDTAAPPGGSFSHKEATSLLLSATVLGMLFGMANTFTRTSRLFPGPHLYGGLVLILLLSVQVSLSVLFNKYQFLRIPHLISGIAVLILLLNQLWSGIGLTQSLIASS